MESVVGAFFLVTKTGGLDPAEAARRARAHFAEAGFAPPETVETGAFSLDVYGKIDNAPPQLVRIGPGDFIGCVGTLVYRGSTGPEALAALHAAGDIEAAIEDCFGHFVLIVGKGGEVTIRRDRFAATETYHDASNTVFSTSLLAVAKVLPERRINPDGVYEFVFYGATLGTDTPFAGIRKLDQREIVAVSDSARLRSRPLALLLPERTLDAAAACDVMLRQLQDQFRAVAQAFDGRVNQALSAGYDTRLMLATFRSIGITPRLFVYGAEGSEDVVAAKAIAAGENLPLEHVDKRDAGGDVDADAFPEMISRNFLDYDGIAHYGIIWNRAEYHERKQRHAGGAINFHGGGGEVLRKCYGFTSLPTTTMTIAQRFYASLDPGICAAPFTREGYEARVAAKIQAMLGAASGRITRQEAEAVYPYFRLRFWFGRDNSINLRYGHSLLPFLDFAYVRDALSLPISVKRFGNLEARMIRTADSRIASYASGYGHDFSADVPLTAAIKEVLTVVRPAWVRRISSAAKLALKTEDIKAGILDDRFVSRVIDLRFPIMSTLFRIDRIRRKEHYGRIVSLEYMFATLGVAGVAEGASTAR
jgi:asparagine synthase (glutamine-hydrolysing)